MWHRAADAGAAEGEPYRTAYARFREAEAVLASRGDRARAVDALTAAHATANELGAPPLGDEALARRALSGHGQRSLQPVEVEQMMLAVVRQAASEHEKRSLVSVHADADPSPLVGRQ